MELTATPVRRTPQKRKHSESDVEEDTKKQKKSATRPCKPVQEDTVLLASVAGETAVLQHLRAEKVDALNKVLEQAGLGLVKDLRSNPEPEEELLPPVIVRPPPETNPRKIMLKVQAYHQPKLLDMDDDEGEVVDSHDFSLYVGPT